MIHARMNFNVTIFYKEDFLYESYARKPTYHQPFDVKEAAPIQISEQIDKYVMFFILLIIFDLKYADAKILEVSTK